MAALKTQQTNASVEDFINSFTETDQMRKDGFELLKLNAGLYGLPT